MWAIFLQGLAALPEFKWQPYQNSYDSWAKRTQVSDLGEREGAMLKFGKKVIADKLKQSLVQTIPNLFQLHNFSK